MVWRRGGDSEGVVHFHFEVGGLATKFPAKKLAEKRCDVNKASASWIEVCFTNFLCVGDGDVDDVIKFVSHIPSFASAGARHHRPPL